MSKNDPRVLSAWCFYDWANSVHSLVIVSGIFPVYFGATALNESGGDVLNFLGFPVKNSVLFSYAISAAFLIIALTSPVCSAIADYSGRRKRFLQFFCYLGAINCALLYFFTRETTTSAVFFFLFSLVGWAGSIVFYNSFLPEIATADRFDALSARGFSMGYVGSVLLMVFNLTMLLKPEWYGNVSSGMASRISFLTVGVWWAGFAQFAFFRLPPDRATYEKRPGWLLNGFRELGQVFRQLGDLPTLKGFLLAYFFYSMGVQTVMYVAAIFADKELHLPAQSLIITVLLIQLVAIAGAMLFARLSKRLGNVRALMIAVVIWMGICTAAYFVTTQNDIFILAGVIGLVMGGIQALSRSTYAKLMPANTENTASFFSFYDVTEKISIVLGTLMYGLVDQLTGSMRNSMLVLLVLFLIGFGLLWRLSVQKIRVPVLAERR